MENLHTFRSGPLAARRLGVAAVLSALAWGLPQAAVAQTAAPAAAPAVAASPHSFTGNVGLVSDYVYRGISQSAHKPAIQGGVDYAHSSGFYAGAWASSVSWVSDNYGAVGLPSASNSIEIDVFGGFKGNISGDLSFDLGLLTYNYPGSNKTVGGTFLKPDSVEVYGALTWKWLTLKYSHSTTALFGWEQTPVGRLEKTTGSGYLELNAVYDLGNGWGISGHLGDQKIKGNGPASYSDYKLGVTKDMGFGVFGLAVTGTNANGACAAGAPASANDVYCWGTAPGKSTYDAGKSVVAVTFNKTF